MDTRSARRRITSYLDADGVAEQLRRDVSEGLVLSPKSLPPKWFYDPVGTDLFDRITRLAEYYPTEAERAALYTHAEEIVALSGCDALAELGSGSSDKTRVLLDAMDAAGRLNAYMPLDVSETALLNAADMLLARYEQLSIDGVVGDFDHHLCHLPRARGEGRRLVAFLGGTIGNYEPTARATLLSTIAGTLAAGECLLLGTDLVKAPERLVAAYDDPEGVTASFNLNLLAVLNRELGADFDLASFDHVARWNAREEWMEMWLRSAIDQRVRVADLDMTVEFAAGEELLTEISAKFRRERVVAELAAAGLEMIGWWTDPAGDFALSLSVRGPAAIAGARR